MFIRDSLYFKRTVSYLTNAEWQVLNSNKTLLSHILPTDNKCCFNSLEHTSNMSTVMDKRCVYNDCLVEKRKKMSYWSFLSSVVSLLLHIFYHSITIKTFLGNRVIRDMFDDVFLNLDWQLKWIGCRKPATYCTWII